MESFHSKQAGYHTPTLSISRQKRGEHVSLSNSVRPSVKGYWEEDNDMAVPGSGSYLIAFIIIIVAERRFAADPRLPSYPGNTCTIHAFNALVLPKNWGRRFLWRYPERKSGCLGG